MEIYTLGHSTRTWAEFSALVRHHRIELIADIRSYPSSRRHPHFNQGDLREALAAERVGYIHIPNLGGRRKPRPDSPNGAWRHPAFRGYADYMETPAFHRGLDALTRYATTARTAYLCSEAVWWKCHRSLVSDALLAAGWDVLHILSLEPPQRHHYTEPAHVHDGVLTYHQPPTQITLL